MLRKDVYSLINSERTYQDNLPSGRTDGHTHNVGEELVLLDVILKRAFNMWVDHPGDIEALRYIRKLAGVAVRCMENHETPPRRAFGS